MLVNNAAIVGPDATLAQYPAWAHNVQKRFEESSAMERKRIGSRARAAIARGAAIAALAAAPALAHALPPGDYRFDVPVDATSRSYLLHVPAQAASRALPLVISLHGGGGNAQQHRQTSGMDTAADRDGYIVAYPDGSGPIAGRLLTWNAGHCCGYALAHRVDDLAFIARLIDDAQRRAKIDASRVYVAGHSNGGMLAHRVGEAMPERVAAIASVAGAYVPSSERATRAMPVLHIHSVDDPRALYAGGLGPPFPLTNVRVQHPAVDAMLAAWVRRNGCDEAATQSETRAADGHSARKLVHGHCRDGASVTHWQLTGAGHGWPGAPPILEALLGPATHVIDADTEIWRFFVQHALPKTFVETGR